jgi:RimJ/RimL family protein N-acetyltransferase
MSTYIFTSERLGFRKFQPADLPIFAAMNASMEVMEFFPNPLTPEESDGLANRINVHLDKHNYTYFAAERLDNQKFIGFLGLALQTYENPYSPFTDIGWRLKKSSWGLGFATEGAKACLKYGFETIGLKEIYSVATLTNVASEKVMQKIGMKKVEEFDHPKMQGHRLERCILYKIENNAR